MRRFLRIIKADLSTRRVEEIPSESLMSAIAAHLHERNIGLTPELESMITQFYTVVVANAAISGQGPPSNAAIFSMGKSVLPSTSSSSQDTKSALSSLFAHSSDDPLNSGNTSPSFNVNFEPTLKYVELPSFDEIHAIQREEAKDILDWLRKCKNVTRYAFEPAPPKWIVI